MAESKGVVIAALIANGFIAILKFAGFLLTGSSAMLSETYHSISDTGNQVFLLFGIFFSKRESTPQHPFGYGKAQFFYSFLVSVLLFGIAGVASVYEAYTALIVGEAHLETGTTSILGLSVQVTYINYAVLVGAFLFETYALSKAYSGMKQEIREHNWSGFREAFRKTSNVTTLTALTEDTVALLGIVFAFVGLLLTQMTGNPVYDGISALLIGLLLMGFALALAWENKRLLLGESLPSEEEQQLRDVVSARDNVVKIGDFRSIYFGPKEVVVTGDVAFDGDLDVEELDERISEIESDLRDVNKKIGTVYIEPKVQANP